MATSACVVYVTAPAGSPAEKIAEKILQARCAACVNIIPAILSSYWWKGKLTRDKEALLIIKTRKNLVTKLIKVVRAVHPYTVPEVIALPIISGHKPYLNWIHAETK